MANFRPIDSKREEFRKYLERAGVMDSLTKALISLYEESEKPPDAIEYIRESLAQGSEVNELNDLREENAKLKERVAQLEAAVGSKGATPKSGQSQLSTHSRASAKLTSGGTD